MSIHSVTFMKRLLFIELMVSKRQLHPHMNLAGFPGKFELKQPPHVLPAFEVHTFLFSIILGMLGQLLYVLFAMLTWVGNLLLPLVIKIQLSFGDCAVFP